MNKSLLKILVATVAVGAAVATTVFTVRKLKKNKTKTEEEIKEETEEKVEELNDEEVKPDSEDSKNSDESNNNLNTDDETDIESKVKQCMEKPLTDDEMIEYTECYYDAHKKKEMNKEKTEDCNLLKDYHKFSKIKYDYLTENHFKNLSKVTCDFIKSLTNEERKYEDLVLEHLYKIKNFHTHVSDEADTYIDTFKMICEAYCDKIKDTIDKSNSDDKEIKKNLIDKYNKFLFDDLFINERRFEVICGINGLN